jgi:hypothetical protein
MKLCPKCQKQFSDDANFCPVDAARLVPVEAQSSGQDTLAARFDLGDRLGGSRTGAVHRATDKTTGKPVVVKVIDRRVLALPGVAQRLERELKQLERVQSAGVAKLVASGRRSVPGGDEYWVATELVDGANTLAEAIGARGPIPHEQAAELVEVVGEALIEAAQVGVVHRDLAPKNVLFAGQEIKLINFSVPVPTTDRVPGVPEFVAPEQVDGRPVDQRSNLYSLGALYYYLLTGQTVFEGAADEVHRLHQNGTIRPPSQITSVPAQVEAVIMRALDRSPTKRFLTVRQFVDEVQRVGHGEVIELKSTMALGKAGARPKGELVQTLMGLAKGGGMHAPAAAKPAPVPAAPTLPVAPVAAASPVPDPKGMAGTMLGIHIEKPPGGMPVQTSPAGPVGMTPLTPAPMQPVAAAQPSPWAQPAATPQPAPPVVAPQPAPPVVAAPVVAAPVLAAPVVAAAPAAAGKKRGDDGGSKGKFRETMWFKKGDLDAEAATRAAEEAARTGKTVDQEKADSLPMEERYKDDGTISRQDKDKYSLKSGNTQAMPSLKDRPKASASQKVSEDALVDEMKGGRTPILIAIFVGLIALGGIIFLLAR